MKSSRYLKWPILSLIAAVALIAGMIWLNHSDRSRPTQAAKSLTVWCAAGLKLPIEELSLQYERAYGTRINVQYGGSGALVSSIEASKQGDLLIAADASYIKILRDKKLAAEAIDLAKMEPALAVATGNPKQIKGWKDLLTRKDLKYGLCHPETAAIGKRIHDIAMKRHEWEAWKSSAAVMKTTVSEIAADLQAGSLDAVFVWDQTIASMPGMERISCPELVGSPVTVPAIILNSTASPASALHFARWLASPEHGAPVFRRHHFSAGGGDAWAEVPEMTLFSGSVNRKAIENVLNQFCEREGVRIKTVYNGCGVLCATMRAAEEQSSGLPDAYYACDVCFVPPVADLFSEAVRLTETDIVIAVPLGNPAGIRTLADLAKPGLRLGICDVKQSALGFLTERLLDRSSLLNAVNERVVSRVPTADLLVNQLRAGSLDAAIVYRANVATLGNAIDALPIDHPAAKAVQPFAVGDQSPRRQLAHRLLETLQAHKADLIAAGFRPLEETTPVPSKSFDAPEFEKK